MKRELTFLRPVGMVICSLMAVASAASFGADAEGLQACQSIEDDAARLACYDAARQPKQAPAAEAAPPESAPPEPVVKPTETPPAAAPAPAAESEVVAQPGTLSDEIGLESVKDKKKEKLSVRGRVTRCEEGRSGKFVFYFDNSQVWRQRGNANVRWKDCGFDVTISEDTFGYVMYRDGDKRKVRIERVK